MSALIKGVPLWVARVLEPGRRSRKRQFATLNLLAASIDDPLVDRRGPEHVEGSKSKTPLGFGFGRFAYPGCDALRARFGVERLRRACGEPKVSPRSKHDERTNSD